MAQKRKPKRDMDERFSLWPLKPEEALRRLLKKRPTRATAEPREPWSGNALSPPVKVPRCSLELRSLHRVVYPFVRTHQRMVNLLMLETAATCYSPFHLSVTRTVHRFGVANDDAGSVVQTMLATTCETDLRLAASIRSSGSLFPSAPVAQLAAIVWRISWGRRRCKPHRP